MRVIKETEFADRLREVLSDPSFDVVGYVTGPGRSGAIAAVYASHLLGVPFLPYGSIPRGKLGRLLIIDTASESGQTMRKAVKKYEDLLSEPPLTVVCYQEPPRVAFWYEAPKPQLYRHEQHKTPHLTPQEDTPVSSTYKIPAEQVTQIHEALDSAHQQSLIDARAAKGTAHYTLRCLLCTELFEALKTLEAHLPEDQRFLHLKKDPAA